MSFILLWDDELWTCCLLWFRAAGLKNISSGCLRLLNKADYDKNNQLLSCHVSFSGFHQHTLFFHVLLILKHLQHLLLKSRLASTESSHIWPPSRPRESRQRLSPLKATHHMCVHDGHAVKISLFPSPQRKETALFQRSPRGRQSDLLHACGFTVKHLSFCAGCVSDSRKSLSGIYWQLQICRWWTNAPLERGSCKKAKGGIPC